MFGLFLLKESSLSCKFLQMLQMYAPDIAQKGRKMKRIFPEERMISGFLILGALLFFFFVIFPLEFSFNAETIFLTLIFIFGFGVAFNFIISHTAYDEENLFIVTLFVKQKIKMDEIIQIARTWEGSGKNIRLKWNVFYRDNYWGREFKTRIYLPEDYNSEKTSELIKTIKNRNAGFVFQINLQ